MTVGRDPAHDKPQCRRPTCTNPVGQQDRSDYRESRFCSIQCETKYEHVRSDARDARSEQAKRHEGQR